MTAAAYIAALHAAGAPPDLGVLALDRFAADLLKIDVRTARRYRCGEIRIPGPVEVALRCLGTQSGQGLSK